MANTPPRKLSCQSDSPHYGPEAFDSRIRIMVDNVLQKRVIEYDQDEGWILKQVQSSDGRYVFLGDNVLTEKKYGAVCVYYEGN